MEESVLLGTKPLVRHFIRDPSGVFSVCHLCECRIIQWRHDSRLLLLLNWFLHIIKRTLHVCSKIWIRMLCSRGKNNISLVRFAHSWDTVLATRTFISSRHRVISPIYTGWDFRLAVGHINWVAAFYGFSYKKMYGRFTGTAKRWLY